MYKNYVSVKLKSIINILTFILFQLFAKVTFLSLRTEIKLKKIKPN